MGFLSAEKNTFFFAPASRLARRQNCPAEKSPGGPAQPGRGKGLRGLGCTGAALRLFPAVSFGRRRARRLLRLPPSALADGKSQLGCSELRGRPTEGPTLLMHPFHKNPAFYPPPILTTLVTLRMPMTKVQHGLPE